MTAILHRLSHRAAIIALVFACALVFGPAALAQPAATNPAAAIGGGRGGGGGAANYPFPYRIATPESVAEVLNRIHKYLDENTPARLLNRQTNEPITDYSKPNPDAVLDRGAFQLVSYEWGVTYAGMLAVSDASGDPRFKDYTGKRLQFFADALPMFRPQAGATPPATNPAAAGRGAARGAPGARGAGGRGGGNIFRGLIAPATLDDCGAMSAALIKARRANVGGDLKSVIDTDIDWISNKQFRLADATLARTRPHPETLWLDDLYMSVPALSQMGKLTGDKKYYDDACKQILQFAGRMFIPENNLWMHGWTSNTDEHPVFHWARANGWAVMAMAELLEVLPEDHPQRADVLKLFRAHVKGLAKAQSGSGLWHNLLDREDTYLETSASAMFVFAMAHGINRGWISPVTYGPVVQLGWNAVTTKVNAQGQVEGTCVGTDLGFDYAFYYYRPTSPLAAHGYGPVLLAGAEMIKMAKSSRFQSTFGTIHYQGPANP